MATPIFILGYPRSGTTWLANILCSHPEIAGIQDKKHMGIVESAYFRDIDQRYGNLKNKSNFIALVQILNKSFYFKKLGISEISMLQKFPTNYENLFKNVMDQYANSQGAKFWLEKTPAHTLFARKIRRYYPEVKFIGITRNYISCLESQIKIWHDPLVFIKRTKLFQRLKLLNQLIKKYALYNRELYRLKRNNQCLVIKFSELQENRRSALLKVCNYLKIEFDEGLMHDVFLPNSSFRQAEHGKLLSNTDKTIIWLLYSIYSIIPRFLLSSFKTHIVNLLINKNLLIQPPNLPAWFFDISKNSEL